MNDAHLHLILNHYPIVGTLFGLGILVTGLILKNKTLINTAYALFIVTTIFVAFSMETGEGAEELVADMPNIGKLIISKHEELSKKLAFLLYALGIMAIVGLFLNSKNNPRAKVVTYIVFGVATAGVILAQKVGASGGEIRHSEIRKNPLEGIDIQSEKEKK